VTCAPRLLYTDGPRRVGGAHTAMSGKKENVHRELERVIDAVAESYGAGRGIDKLESAALPNQRKVAEALSHLEHVIYMGCYSARELDLVNLRHHLSDHLYDAFEMLVEQTARATAYYRSGGSEPSDDDEARSRRAVIDVFSRIPALRELADFDVRAAFDGDPAAGSIEEIIFSYPGLLAVTVYRIAHEFYEHGVPMIPRIMTEDAHGRTGIDIHPGARLGRSFFIDHGTGVVIGETTVIGDNVKIYQSVTLGALAIQRDEVGALVRGAKRHPTIEDDVTIYAGAKILGGETVIGRGSVVGGNVWLTESVPPYTQVTYSAARGCEMQTIRQVEQGNGGPDSDGKPTVKGSGSATG
jgi:serine O-acetyltransferase